MTEQLRNRIDVETLLNLPSVWHVSASWTGNEIAYYGNRTGRLELYHLDLLTRAETQITNGEAPAHLMAGFVWTRDSLAIVFAKDEKGNEQHNLIRVDLDSRTFTQLNDDPTSQEYPGQVAPDNRKMLVSSNRAGQMNLFTLDLTDHTWTQLTDYAKPAMGGSWSRDGDRIAYSTNESDDLQNSDVYVMNADGSGKCKVISLKIGSQEWFGDWHPDGKRVAFSSDASGVSRPGLFDLASGDIRWLGHEGIEESASHFSKSGKWLLTTREMDSTIMPALYDVATGAEHALRLPPGVAYGAQFVLNETRLMVTYTTANRRPEVLLYDLETDEIEVLFAAEYNGINPDVFVSDTFIRYPSTEAVDVPALLSVPRDIPSGEKLPAIIYVHGGPTGQWFRNFDPQVQILVDQGYVVLQPNVRGSSGYGVEWRDACLGDWGGRDLDDVAEGVAYLKGLPYVDGDRIGIYGISYGGYMSYIAVTKQPNLFKVGAPFVGISDLLALYEESMEHFKYYLQQQMGHPVEDADRWLDRSATTHADNLQAKMLIVHGVNDPRCPISQARIFRDKLLAAGKREGVGGNDDFEYHEFEEGHGASGDNEGEIRNFKLLLDFLERRL